MSSLFQRLFAPGSLESEFSDDELSETESMDSGTQFTDMSGSVDSDSDSDDSTEPSATSTQLKLDRDLRARHRAACKNMTVSVYYVISK
jgi:hypothetical protein